MRFLQTEWHRHERDRNSWEIERQEMKGRIARLEGSTRKSDIQSKSLKKVVNMLEKALKNRDEQIKALKSGADVKTDENSKEAKEGLAVKSNIPRREYQMRDCEMVVLTDHSTSKTTQLFPRYRW